MRRSYASRGADARKERRRRSFTYPSQYDPSDGDEACDAWLEHRDRSAREALASGRIDARLEVQVGRVSVLEIVAPYDDGKAARTRFAAVRTAANVDPRHEVFNEITFIREESRGSTLRQNLTMAHPPRYEGRPVRTVTLARLALVAATLAAGFAFGALAFGGAR